MQSLKGNFKSIRQDKKRELIISIPISCNLEQKGEEGMINFILFYLMTRYCEGKGGVQALAVCSE